MDYSVSGGSFGSAFGFVGLLTIFAFILTVIVLIIVVVALLTFIRVANTGDRALKIYINKNKKYDDNLNYGNSIEETDDEEN